MPLTPEDVRNKQFTTVRLREGYDEDEVDAFLDEVEAELTRLLRENEDLRAKLAAATRAAAQNQQQQHAQAAGAAGRPRPGCPGARRHIRSAGASSSRRRWADRPSCPVAPAAAAVRGTARQPTGPARWAGPRVTAPAMGQGGPMGRSHGPGRPHGPGSDAGWSDGRPRWAAGAPWAAWVSPAAGRPAGDSAARVLSLAQQTADQAIAEARSEANKIVGEARSRAEGLERDARAKADALERDAQEKHRVAMGSLESARATLERKVEDLRGFEREYRTRLKSYLESQLRQLENQADDSLAPPRTPAAASLPPSPSTMAAAGGRFHGGTDGWHRHGQRWAAAPRAGRSALDGGQQQMSPAMTQPMAPVRPQGPQPLQQAPTPMRGFLIDEDDN